MQKAARFSTTHRWLLPLILILIGTTIPQSTAISLSNVIQPALLQVVDNAPDSIISLIVQQKTRDETLAKSIALLEGKVTKDLPIINAFAAELPARQVVKLARDARVRWISLDAPVVDTKCEQCVNASISANNYNSSIRADLVWNEEPHFQGQNITVAVVDSGIKKTHADFSGRVLQSVNIAYPDFLFDGYGHGTYVAGIIAGDGSRSAGAYMGIAPKANLLDVRVTSFAGAATESDVVAGLQWIYDHRADYNIRIVNLSFNASLPQSYHTSPLNAACEMLWFNGVVVVAAAGNHGMDAIYPPANDPFIITVGAVDDRGTASIADDEIASFSAYGTTADGTSKPDLVAPGRNLVGPLNDKYGLLALLHPKNVLQNNTYLRMSGTSAAAPVVTGAVALLLQAEPQLTPDQVKYRLLATANKTWNGYDPVKAGAGYLDIYAAIHSNTLESANIGLPVSSLITTDSFVTQPSNEITLDSIKWSSIKWSSVTWSTLSWNSIYWENETEMARMNDHINDSTDVTAEASREPAVTHIFLPVITTDMP
ncbi:MAG: S8 family peptidase [Caldilineaceae bacterium]